MKNNKWKEETIWINENIMANNDDDYSVVTYKTKN